jgi:hypothetical protein
MNTAPVLPRARTAGARPRIARYGFAGIALVLVAWIVAWSHLRPWSDETFFPLWLGYIITVDALVRPRLGRSLLQAGPRRVLLVFATSAVVWWLFELLNVRVDNWHYHYASPVGPVRFAVEATIDFSTVLPAIFETAALMHLILAGSRELSRPLPSLPVWAARISLTAGVIFLVLPLFWPGTFFPLVWVCLFFIVDPINARLGMPSLLAGALAGHLRPALVLAAAGLTCGFFWEMWNFLSMPRWTYTVPLIPQQRLFEMPLLGYSGYVPFALECFAIYTLASYAWRRRDAVIGGPAFVPLD